MATAAAAAVLFLLRANPRRSLLLSIPPLLHRCRALSAVSAADIPSRPGGAVQEAEEDGKPRASSKPLSRVWMEHPDFRKWKEKEVEILDDVEPTIAFAKEILHSGRYRDGECLSAEDEKVVVEKLLAYHPRCEDKIGCGLNTIMVDRHPEFRVSRCFFVVRTDGGWIDFSYQKCLRAYIRTKYPSDAERFIKEHFKRT